MRGTWLIALFVGFTTPALAEETPAAVETPAETPIITRDIAPPDFDYQLPEEPAPETPAPQNAAPEKPAMSPEPVEADIFSLPEDEAIHKLLSEPEKTTGIYTAKANLQGLNKVTAKAYAFEAPVNTPVTFGSLEIILKKCWKSPPEEIPENKALLEIWETKPGEEKLQIFYGWMLSSSPAVSALEHPVYDITVLSCMEGATPSPDAPKAGKKE